MASVTDCAALLVPTPAHDTHPRRVHGRRCACFRRVQQTDYRIKLVAVASRVIKVKDELKFSFDLVGRNQE